MFRKMRRAKREIPAEDVKVLLKTNIRGAFSVNGDNGYPFTVPIDFYYEESENRIYFHSAKEGHKIDSIKADDKVCFTTWNDGYLEEGDWAYYVSSAVVFGRARLITNQEVAVEKIKKLAMKYYPTEEEVDAEIAKDMHGVQMVAIDIEHATGKKIHEK